jgi:pyruvyltransferase
MLRNRIINKLKRISIVDTISIFFNKKDILFWSTHEETKLNFGDAINPYLFENITSKPVASAHNIFNLFQRPVYYFIGSILNNLNNKNAIICGSGFISADATITKKPKSVIAVRGPLSREIFLKHGISCPEVYCDPALLLPYFIKQQKQIKNCDIGIIAHYADKKVLQDTTINSSGMSFKFIDIESEKENFIEEVCSCKCILSSSLHGIIVAHAYGISTVWIKLSNNLIGGDFKFNDYAFSTGNQK